ncbi:AMP-binding enzyme [Halalkalibacter krulwichiae]|uniref:AMP-binding enzyme n=1 Tax=Halalkalibacter krulwichiae TaxID=199441 RepID=UPI001C55EAA4
MGEVPKAYIVTKSHAKLTADEIKSFCKGKLANYKIPKEFDFINELPRNPSGKVLKRILRENNRMVEEGNK